MDIGVIAVRNVAIGLLVAGAGALTYVVFDAPSRPAVRLGIRGYKRQQALRDPAWGLVEPAVRWLGLRLSGVMSDVQYASVERRLVLAGDYLGLTPPEYVALTVLASCTGVAVGYGLGQLLHMGVLVILGLTLLGAFLPYMLVSEETDKRLRSISSQLPNVIDLVALAMGAGLDFPAAIRQVVEKSSQSGDPLLEEFGWILRKLGLANTRRQALEEFAERAPIAIVLEFVGAVIQADERGHPLARVLQVQAATCRQRRSVSTEESAAKAGVALMAPLLMLFLAVLLLVMAPLVIRISQSGVLGAHS